MTYAGYSKLRHVIPLLIDNEVWTPFNDEDGSLEEFRAHISTVEKSLSSTKSGKGKPFEMLVSHILSRFTVGSTQSDFTVNDNQIDHEFRFIEQYFTNFTMKIGDAIVCECKNENSPVNVTYVSKLLEICENRRSKLGVFFSIRGLTGAGWIHAEGKRKKNFLKKGIGILSFTFSEIKDLEEINFFTLVKQKYQQLIDECDDETDDVRLYPNEELVSFKVRLQSTIDELVKLQLLSVEDYETIKLRIDTKYL